MLIRGCDSFLANTRSTSDGMLHSARKECKGFLRYSRVMRSFSSQRPACTNWDRRFVLGSFKGSSPHGRRKSTKSTLLQVLAARTLEIGMMTAAGRASSPVAWFFCGRVAAWRGVGKPLLVRPGCWKRALAGFSARYGEPPGDHNWHAEECIRGIRCLCWHLGSLSPSSLVSLGEVADGVENSASTIEFQSRLRFPTVERASMSYT